MKDTTDKDMIKWWAQYTESTGDMDGALKIYQKADDYFSQVNFPPANNTNKRLRYSHIFFDRFPLQGAYSLFSWRLDPC